MEFQTNELKSIPPEEWPMTMALARVFIACEELKGRGLLGGGPKVNVDKCRELIAEGESLGYSYSEEQFKQATVYVASGAYLDES